MIRKHDDSIKSGVGIDEDLGEDFSKKWAVDPWNDNPQRNNRGNRGVPTTSARAKGDDDFSRGAVGIDGTLGEDDLRRQMPRDDLAQESISSNSHGSRNEGPAKNYDIWSEVNEQSGEVDTTYAGSAVKEVRKR